MGRPAGMVLLVPEEKPQPSWGQRWDSFCCWANREPQLTVRRVVWIVTVGARALCRRPSLTASCTAFTANGACNTRYALQGSPCLSPDQCTSAQISSPKGTSELSWHLTQDTCLQAGPWLCSMALQQSSWHSAW